MNYKLGKKPARAGAVKLRFAAYADAAALPTLPQMFGHDGLISSWPTLANDQYGDCVWAGAAHETMLLAKEAGNTVTFTDADVLADYAAVTGFKPDDHGTDQGTDLQVAASYRRKTGIIDATGRRHRIASYLALEPGNVSDILLAAYMFVCGVGLQLPSSALDQTKKKMPWYYVADSPVEGGHYVPLIGRRADGLFVFVSWGAIQLATPHFVRKYCDEAIAYLSQENLVNRKSPEGFDYDTLTADLARLA